MKRCKTNVRSHETKGYEIELIGECTDTVNELMKNLGPYGQQYLKKRLVFTEKDTSTSARIVEDSQI